MEIQVARIGILDNILPAKTRLEILDHLSVKELLYQLDEQYKGVRDELIKGDKLTPGIRILLNGRSISGYKGLSTELNDGDRLLITILINGG